MEPYKVHDYQSKLSRRLITPTIKNIMAKTNIAWSAKGSIVKDTFGFKDLDEKAAGIGESRFCPTYFEVGEILTVPDEENFEFFLAPFKKNNGDIDHMIMFKIHSSIRGEFFIKLPAFLNIPIAKECVEYFKKNRLTHHLLEVESNDIRRLKYLVGKTILVKEVLSLHKAGWETQENGVRRQLLDDAHLQPLTLWTFEVQE